MNALLRALSTSVGRKFVMGATGLLLCGFLVVHLAGNILLYAGADAYNHYVHALHSREGLVKVAETVLLLLFVLHIALALVVSRANRAARKVRYASKESKLESRLLHESVAPDTWMLLSGAIVLGFLLLHLADFTFEVRPDFTYEGKSPYQKAAALLQTPLTRSVYVVGCLVLGMHLGHGFSSAFKSLGVSHPKYDGLVKWFGVLFGLVMAIGFASFPVLAESLNVSGGPRH